MPLSQSWIDENPFLVNTVLPGLVFFILGSAVTWFFARKFANAKTLDYEVISDVRVLRDVTSNLNSKIEVTVDGKVVEQPRFVTIRYRNTGNTGISDDDFDGGVALKDTTGVENAKLVRLSNDKLKATESGLLPNRKFYVESLNRKDYFDVQYLVDGAMRSTPLEPDFRIKGETRTGKVVSNHLKRDLILQVLCLVGAVIAFLSDGGTVGKGVFLSGILIGVTSAVLISILVSVLRAKWR